MSGTGRRAGAGGGRSLGRPRTRSTVANTGSSTVGAAREAEAGELFRLQEYQRCRQRLRHSFGLVNQRATDIIKRYQAKVTRLKSVLKSVQENKARYEQELVGHDKKIQKLDEELKRVERELEGCLKMEPPKCVDYGDPDGCCGESAAGTAKKLWKEELGRLEKEKDLLVFGHRVQKKFRKGVAEYLAEIESAVQRNQQEIRDLETFIDHRDHQLGLENQDILLASIFYRRIYLGSGSRN